MKDYATSGSRSVRCLRISGNCAKAFEGNETLTLREKSAAPLRRDNRAIGFASLMTGGCIRHGSHGRRKRAAALGKTILPVPFPACTSPWKFFLIRTQHWEPPRGVLAMVSFSVWYTQAKMPGERRLRRSSLRIGTQASRLRSSRALDVPVFSPLEDIALLPKTYKEAQSTIYSR